MTTCQPVITRPIIVQWFRRKVERYIVYNDISVMRMMQLHYTHMARFYYYCCYSDEIECDSIEELETDLHHVCREIIDFLEGLQRIEPLKLSFSRGGRRNK